MSRHVRFGAKMLCSTPGSVHPAQNLTGNRLGRVPDLENHAKSRKIVKISKSGKFGKSKFEILISYCHVSYCHGGGCINYSSGGADFSS